MHARVGVRAAAAAAAVMMFSALAPLAAAQGSAFALAPGTKVLAPIQFRQLAVFPVVEQTTQVDTQKYVTLAEGMAGKKIAVTEAKQGAQVNRVTVANHSERPLLLLGGEVILGGQQDRIIGKDTVVPPREEMTVEVFCVEHGRWQGRKDFQASGGMADVKVRERAKYAGDQSGVWQEVAKKNATLGAKPSTGTYRQVSAGPEGEKAIKPYREAIAAALGKLPESKHLVGVIAAINGRVVSVDVFGSPTLFASYRDKLLDSLFVSAADQPVKPAAKAPAPAEIKAFLQTADDAPASEVARSKGSRTVENKGKGVVRSKVEVDGKPGDRPVYESYQAQ